MLSAQKNKNLKIKKSVFFEGIIYEEPSVFIFVCKL